MQVIVQRVRRASVRVEDEVVGQVGLGLFALVGVGQDSREEDAVWLARKTVELRVFADEQGRMERGVADVGGGVLAVSQFTLYADIRKGRRPSFVRAAPPEPARALYERYCREVEMLGVPAARGVFGAHMVIDLTADGPVTLRLHRDD